MWKEIPKLKHKLVGSSIVIISGRSFLLVIFGRGSFRPLFRSEGALHSALATYGLRGRCCAPDRPAPRARRQMTLENCIASTSIFVLPSYKEPTVDALASTTDEGRVWLRKATVSCLESVTNRGCPNGETRRLSGRHSGVNT